MKKIIPLFVLLLLLIKLEAQEISFLKLKQAFKYEDNINVPQFSGLCVKDGELYSINDKGTNCLYKLSIDTQNSTFRSNCTQISNDKNFEGLCYFNNSFYLVDEKECMLYKISNNTANSHGATFLESLKSARLIDTGGNSNRQIESLGMLSDTTFIIATERVITSLAIINNRGEILSKTSIPPLHYDDNWLPGSFSGKEQNEKDANSFSDLCVFKGKVYLLERQKKLIHVFDISLDSFTIVKTLSFKYGINSCDEYNPFYGAAEGLAIDDNFIYIILDNNGFTQKNRSNMCDNERRTLFQFYKD
jgi:hypothetical protein